MSNDRRDQGRELSKHSSALPELQDLNPPEPMTLGELLAEYDLNVLKRWVEDQKEQERAQEIALDSDEK